jgi:hypothetical protein
MAKYRKATLISLLSGDTTVYTLSADLLKDDGGAHMQFADFSVKAGQINYSFTHNPGVDPDTGLADANAAFGMSGADGTVRIEGYDNLRAFRYTISGNTDFYIALGA